MAIVWNVDEGGGVRGYRSCIGEAKTILKVLVATQRYLVYIALSAEPSEYLYEMRATNER